MNKISAIIVAKNSPKHLFESILSIQNIVKEIVMIDIGLDQSVIAKLRQNKKIKIVEVKQDVPYVELIREEAKKYASEDYLLYIDPDEIVPQALAKILTSRYDSYDYIKIPRKNIIFDKWIEHSRWWPDYQIRLFKKNAVVWPKKIHAQPTVTGKGFTIDPNEECALIHYNYENIDEFIHKMTRYAKAEANELSSFPLSEALKKALSEFTSRYFAEEGYKDGIHGFVLAFLQMFYYFIVYIYHWEIKGKPPINSQELINIPQLFFRQGVKESGYWMIKKKLVKGKDVIKNKIIGKLLS